MINHFNAFISYKHADLDNKIAASIVRDLEHFHIPKKIQKATGVKRIERIFRDKDELPITSDLNDTISMALHNADYLIVICSTNTKYSTWVEKEIEVFLQNHTMNQILTVLADGEPNEVIPKCLLTGKKEVVDEDGVKRIVEMPFEPLSCDYRIPYKRAKAEEVPRMVAAIIGCSYDELINRHRQYKMRRLTAVFAGAMALSLGFAGYMLHSNTLIHENYLEALKNQSRNLANQSERLLDEENRIEAMQLALESLPKSEDDEKPVTAEAVRAITKSSRAYVSLAGGNVDAVWNYKMPNHVKQYKLSEKNTYLGALDDNSVVIAWDTKTHKQVLNLENYGDDADDIYFFGDDKLIVKCEKSIHAYDLSQEGKEIWVIQDNDYSIPYVHDVFTCSDDAIIVAASTGKIKVVSMKDGQVIQSFDIVGDDPEKDVYIPLFDFSEDKGKLAYILMDRTDSSAYTYRLGEYDLTTDTNTVSEEAMEEYVKALTYQGDRIVLACEDESNSSTMLFDFNFVAKGTDFIKCYSSGNLNPEWTSDFTYLDLSEKNEFLPMAGDKIAYAEGDTYRVWDVITGEIIGTYDTNDTIVDISDRDNDGVPMFVTQSGASGTSASLRDVSGVSMSTLFSDDLREAIVKGGVYTLRYMDRQIIYYTSGVYDEDWTRITEVPAYKTGGSFCLDENVLAVFDIAKENPELIFVDPVSKTYLGSAVLSSTVSAYQYKLLGSYEDVFYAVHSEDKKLVLTGVDLNTMQVSTEIICDEYSEYDPVCDMKAGKLVYYGSEDNSYYYVVKRDIATGEETRISLDGKMTGITYFPEKDCAYLATNKEYTISAPTDAIVSFSDEALSYIEMPEQWLNTGYVVLDESGKRIAASDGEKIRILDVNGEFKGEVACNNVSPLGISFKEVGGKELLLVAFDNGTLNRYDAETAEFLGRSDLTVVSMASLYEADMDYDKEQGLLYVQIGTMLDIIETDTWIELTSISNCYGHNKETDTFITSGYDGVNNGIVGYFEHYSVDRLIQKARDYLQGEEMSDELKSMYGISG